MLVFGKTVVVVMMDFDVTVVALVLFTVTGPGGQGSECLDSDNDICYCDLVWLLMSNFILQSLKHFIHNSSEK